MSPTNEQRLRRAFATYCTAPRSTDEFIRLLYDDLRKLARARLRAQPPGNTLQPTALVHEMWMRLGSDREADWNSRRHFFVAASEAMRQIIVDAARAKNRIKRGGDRVRIELRADELVFDGAIDEVLAVNEALAKIEEESPRTAEVLRLRYLGGLSVEETAAAMDLSPRTVKREWRAARAMVSLWLNPENTDEEPGNAGTSD